MCVIGMLTKWEANLSCMRRYRPPIKISYSIQWKSSLIAKWWALEARQSKRFSTLGKWENQQEHPKNHLWFNFLESWNISETQLLFATLWKDSYPSTGTNIFTSMICVNTHDIKFIYSVKTILRIFYIVETHLKLMFRPTKANDKRHNTHFPSSLTLYCTDFQNYQDFSSKTT